jgi:hypothetical protein
MNVLKSKELSIGIMFAISVLYIFEYFIKGVEPLSNLAKVLGNWMIVISAIAMGLGLMNLTMIHLKNIIQKKGNIFYSGYTIFIMLITFILGAYGGSDFPPYQWIFNNMYQAVGPVFFSFSFLYMCAAAVRAFRVSSADASLLLIAGFIVMLGNTPVVTTFFGSLPPLKDWIFAVPSRGVWTAFRISVALGLVLIGIRTIMGVEKSYIGEEGG